MKKLLVLIALFISSLVLASCTNPFDKSNKSGLQVLTNDIPALIYLDGKQLDSTPFIDKELKPGEYLLKIEPENTSLVPYETTINLRKGLLTVVTWKPGNRPELSGGVVYELEKLASEEQTELAITSIPDGAVISIDEGGKEFSPLLHSDLEAGSHEITIALPSYETQSHTVNVVKGHRLNVLVTLAKSIGTESDELSTDSASESAELASSPSPSPSPSVDPQQNIDLNLVQLDPNTPGTVTITSTNFFQNGKEVLRVRDAIGVSGKELGFAEVGKSYKYLEVTEKNWYKIDFEGNEGWVSGQYATLNKAE